MSEISKVSKNNFVIFVRRYWRLLGEIYFFKYLNQNLYNIGIFLADLNVNELNSTLTKQTKYFVDDIKNSYTLLLSLHLGSLSHFGAGWNETWFVQTEKKTDGQLDKKENIENK